MANTMYIADVPTAGTVLPAARTKAVDGGAGMVGGQSFGKFVSQKKGTAGPEAGRPGLGSEHAEQHAFLQPGSHQAILLFVAGLALYTGESTKAGIMPRRKRAADDTEAEQSKRSRPRANTEEAGPSDEPAAELRQTAQPVASGLPPERREAALEVARRCGYRPKPCERSIHLIWAACISPLPWVQESCTLCPLWSRGK